MGTQKWRFGRWSFLFKQVIVRFHVHFPGCMYLLCISCDLVERFPRRPGMLKFNTPAIGWHLQAHGRSVSTWNEWKHVYKQTRTKQPCFTRNMTKNGFDLGLCFFVNKIKSTYSRNHKQLGTLEGSLYFWAITREVIILPNIRLGKKNRFPQPQLSEPLKNCLVENSRGFWGVWTRISRHFSLVWMEEILQQLVLEQQTKNKLLRGWSWFTLIHRFCETPLWGTFSRIS